MNNWIMAATLLGVASAAQAQPHPHHGKRHAHHAPAAARAYPDSVTLDGKPYKVCKGGMQDDCVQPRQAGLGYGNRPTHSYHADKTKPR